MPQSMLIIMAMIVFSFLMLTQQRTSSQAQFTAVKNTVGILANGVATERLELVSARGFDQGTVDHNALFHANDLSSVQQFGPSQDKAGDDVDDFDGTSVTIARGFGADTLRFQAETTVYYVQGSNPHAGVKSSVPTKHKKIDVTVYSLGMGVVKDTVRLSRVMSCKSSCQW